MEAVGIRELRQNLSVYLKRVTEEGETFEVTDHGKPVALLSPRKGEDWYQAMVAAGRIRPGKGNFKDLPPPLPARPGEKPLSELISEMREDRI